MSTAATTSLPRPFTFAIGVTGPTFTVRPEAHPSGLTEYGMTNQHGDVTYHLSEDDCRTEAANQMEAGICR